MSPGRRLEERARAWGVTIERTSETGGSVLAFGLRGGEPVVLKVARDPRSNFGRVLEEFGGHGTVRVHAHVPGAALLERLRPGTPLVALCRRGEDEAATEILAGVIRAMEAATTRTAGFPGVSEWGDSFRAAREAGGPRLPADLVEEAAHRYAGLCASQTRVRLLHGDLHHDNVIRDAERGWLAIDPKGVVGEREYELGAALRNPYEDLERFAAPDVIERRIGQFERALDIDASRVLEWAFAQAVLAAIWEVEDGSEPESGSPFLRLAAALRPMLDEA